MKQGKIKWFDENKGYGFIEDKNETLIFLHFSDVAKEEIRKLKNGTPVKFNTEKDGTVIRAKEIEIIDL